MSRLGICVLGIVLAASLAQAASAQIETVVVTGERRSDYDAPHVYIVKRADFLITKVRVTCDTRDLSQRKQELKETLRAMIRSAAGTKSISLGVGDDIVTDLDESNFDEIIEPDNRADTSAAEVIIKTAVTKDDTFNGATARIKEYVDKTPKIGRTEILLDKSWNLTLVGPEQYRDALVTQIVADARHTADLFGAGNGVTIEGLEHRVTWFQKTSLDLGLYIPYTLHIAPLGSR